MGSPDAYIISELLMAEILSLGFDVQVVDFSLQQEYAALIAEVDTHALWDRVRTERPADAVLMVTPTGFRHISTAEDFNAWLPAVEPLELIR